MTCIEVWGISNCDSVKKACKWLDARGIAYVFHDFKKEGADAGRVARWVGPVGLDIVLNRRGTTWRKLSDEDKARAEGNDAVSLLVQHPSMIKRPVVEHGDTVLVGFKEDIWDAHFS